MLAHLRGLAPLRRILLHLLHLGNDIGREGGALDPLDEAPASLPVPHLDRAVEGPRAQHHAVLEALLRHGDAAGQRHVVGLVASPPSLHNAKLNGDVPHPGWLPPARVHLRQVHSQLLWDWLSQGVTVIHRQPAKAPPRVEELKLACVAEMLATHKLLHLRVKIVLHCDQATAWHGDLLGLQGPAAGGAVLDLHEAELHLHVLDKLGKAILRLDASPVDVHAVSRHNTLLGEIRKSISAELPVDPHCAGVPGILVDLE
mmetsp:Transcript_107460/g.321401  ORF Transcript_107460/g.321401 Transcript_107460/m.321401 type:complete len:258 (+) Transcript_107460:246-1019(+)